jgi:competence protein ComEA
VPDLPPAWRHRLDSLPVEPSQIVAAVVAVAVVIGVGLGWVLTHGRDAGPKVPIEQLLPSAVSSTLPPAGPEPGTTEAQVHAAGAVRKPGVYALPLGSRVSDLLAAAGGATPDADLDQVNLAARVGDGERIYLPRKGESAPGISGAGPPSTPLDLNTATAEQLDALPGVGPSTAAAIVEHRTEHGRFRSVEELLEVRGIGPAKLASIRSKVKV